MYRTQSSGVGQGTTETWAWRDGEDAVVCVRAETGPDGSPSAVTLVEARRVDDASLEEPGPLEWTTASIQVPATGSHLMAEWLGAVRAQDRDPRAALLEPLPGRGSSTADDDETSAAVLSAASSTARVRTARIEDPGPWQPTVQAVLEDPEHTALTVPEETAHEGGTSEDDE